MEAKKQKLYQDHQRVVAEERVRQEDLERRIDAEGEQFRAVLSDYEKKEAGSTEYPQEPSGRFQEDAP